MLTNCECPLCGGHMSWVRRGAGFVYWCDNKECDAKMTEQEVLAYRQGAI